VQLQTDVLARVAYGSYGHSSLQDHITYAFLCAIAMHWKGLRLGALYDSEKRHLTEPQIQSRHSEQLHRPTQSTTNLAPRNSESLPRSPISAEDDNDHGESGGNKGTFFAGNTSLKSKLPSALHASRDNLHMRGNRFSLMRLRHASDPQLSKSYAKGEAEAQTPPVPSIPPRK
jgi:hypothetical protein